MQATMHRDAPASAYMPSNIVDCVSALVRVVRLPSIVKNLWTAGSTGLSVAFKSCDVSLVESTTGAVAPMYPAFYGDCAADTVFVGCPSGHVVDLVLFLSALHTPALTAVLVPTSYHLHAPPARIAALGRLTRAGRLCTVVCAPCGDMRLVKSEWILVFRDAATKAAMLLPGATVVDLPVPP